jgi:hypothetical protein
MSMHLHHPALSYNGKKKGKIKFASAAAKRKAEELYKEWRELQNKWGLDAEEKKRQRAMSAEPLDYKLSAPPGRETQKIASRDTGHHGAVKTKGIPQYTGTKVLGIGTMHKSNAVPIFSDEEAIAISSMRR